MKYDPRMRRAVCGTFFVSAALAFVACGSFGTDDDAQPSSALPDAADGDGSSPLPDAAPPDANALDGGGGRCPTGFGPAMVVTAVSSDRAICVDVSEVSSAMYAEFRAKVTDVTPFQPLVPSGCEMLAAAALDPADDAGALPRRSVSFCSAAFYCASQGKRLCGSLADGSGLVKADDGGAPVENPPLEWEGACAGGQQRDHYPWGNTDPAPAAAAGCLTADTAPDAGVRPVATSPVCGPANGPYDMIGNVWEWVSLRVDKPSASVSYSGLRGGAWNAATPAQGCATPHGADAPLGTYAAGRKDVGFRCCADPK
jgi:hypothetical protein